MTTATSRILVIGGYGAVGATVTSTLGQWFPGRVIAAGRSAARVREAGGVRVDVTEPDGLRKVLDDLGDVAVVVLCVEPPDGGAARICLERGIHLVDIGATPRLLDAVSGLHDVATDAGATAVLSVGVAPGLTNLLARRAHEAVGGADRIDITVLLGSGERHGDDALRWTVGGLTATPSAAPARTALPGYGSRTAHWFPFSDQRTLPRTLAGVDRATTRLCLDSRLLTAALFALRRVGLLRAARHEPVSRVLVRVFGKLHTGGDGFAVRVDAWRGGDHAAYALEGRRQSVVTGLVAAHVARELLSNTLPTGVHHIEQLPALHGIPEALARHGVRCTRRSAPDSAPPR
ncbi:saccharopine dehydrogenase NADP-binding domain-containing protein [Streptomyces sp. NBC_00237]|uniref:saccharopine dehydrogenase family protein n=1 Tax=Streptomyces sp. NBC_00237 TaxID=2975687 RepID=UPI0022550B9B|nr:saccharopine dehydrogenase NADP-binding domain-containing protein [Streptomyces sp. NBC_00237]MCX5204512.1 saccharopine dehydrogenase NADP-binding domain-containing protein [Streptomyces sp. NBC_00237]